jgi:Papain family cysteine protease
MLTYAQRQAESLLLSPIDLRTYLTGGAPSQGPRPLCVPFSVSGVHEATRSFSMDAVPKALAVEPLWQSCVSNGSADHQGTTLVSVGHAVQVHGQTQESVWPYNPSLGAGTESTPSSASSASWFTATLIDVPIAHDGIEFAIESALSLGLTLALVIEITPEFERPMPGGEVAVPPLASAPGDYHAVMVVGTATNDLGTTRRLLIRNSWGTGWGLGGFGWLPYDYLIAFAVQASVLDPTSLSTSGGL